MDGFRSIILLAALFIFQQTSSAGFLNRLEKWDSYQTEHFSLRIPRSAKAEVPRLTTLCENIWDSLSVFFHYKPENKIRLVFLDDEDYSNGFAIGFAGWVTVYLYPADFALRETRRWTPNVTAHEIAHVFSLQKMGQRSKYLGHDLGLARMGKSSSVTLNTAYSPLSEQSWLTEGIAQLGAEACGFDSWGALRDMTEKVAIATEQGVSEQELRTFLGNSRESEVVYNQGYSFLRWVLQKTGLQGWQRIMDHSAELSLEEAIALEMHADFSLLFRMWRRQRSTDIPDKNSAPGGKFFRTLELPSPLWGIYQKQTWPVLLPSGALAWIGSQNNDHGIERLYLTRDGSTRMLDRNATFPLKLDRHGKLLYLAFEVSKNGALLKHLKEYDSEKDKTIDLKELPERISSFAPCAGLIALVHHEKARNHLSVYESGKNRKLPRLPDFSNPLEVECLDDNTVAVLSVTDVGKEIWTRSLSEADDTPWRALLRPESGDLRQLHFDKGELYFSWDRSGRFQIYSLNISSGEIMQQSNVPWGAFTPFASDKGLLFSSYGPAGFEIGILDRSTYLPVFDKQVELANHATGDSTTWKLGGNADRNSLLGWSTHSSFWSDAQNAPDSLAERISNPLVGSQGAVAGAAFYMGNPSGTSMGALGFSGNSIRNSALFTETPGFSVEGFFRRKALASSFSGQLILQFNELDNTANRLFEAESLTTADSLTPTDRPWMGTLQALSTWQQSLTVDWDIWTSFAYSELYLADKRLTKNMPVGIFQQLAIAPGLTWGQQEFGRDFINRGMTASLFASTGIQGMLLLGALVGSYGGGFELQFNENLARFLFFEATGSWEHVKLAAPSGVELMQQTGEKLQTRLSVSGPLPWPSFRIFPFWRRSPNIKELFWSAGGTALEKSGIYSPTNSTASGVIKPVSELRPLSASGSELQPRIDNTLLSAGLRWKIITTTHSTGVWAIDVKLPAKALYKPVYSLSLTF